MKYVVNEKNRELGIYRMVYIASMPRRDLSGLRELEHAATANLTQKARYLRAPVRVAISSSVNISLVEGLSR